MSVKVNSNNTQLFTEKYRPQSYSDLLTEEKTNREILTWMKSWDEIVFQRKFHVPTIQVAPQFLKSSNKVNKPTLKEEPLYIEVDYVQSKHKILLISGAPGIGKTTLANVIATHCGYEPIVVNASDERTVDKLITKIYDTTLIHNVKRNNKPTCLILDEIDGINVSGYSGKRSIKNIIDFIKNGKVNKQIIERNKKEVLANSVNNSNPISFQKAKPITLHKDDDNDSSSNKSDDSSDEGKEQANTSKFKRKNKKNENAIKRPVICICNDIYNKNLLLLRKESLVYNLRKNDEKKIIDRLYEIIQLERIPLTKQNLKQICEITKYDIRACLNCLQFISYNKTNMAFLSTISQSIVSFLCNKDINENLFNIWNVIFFPNQSSTLNYMSIKHLYNSSGEFNKIIEGLFTNYLNIKPKNSYKSIENIANLTELFSYEDMLQKKGFSTMSYETYNYSCMSGLYIASYYQNETFDRNIIDYPNLLYEINNKKRINASIIDNLKENIFENRRSGLTNVGRKIYVEDILPYVYQIIQPEIRGINLELMNKEELKQLQQAVGIMLYFGIDFKEGNDEMEVQYLPDIRKIVDYDNGTNVRITENKKVIIKMEYEKMKSMKRLKNGREPFIGKEEKKNGNDNKDKINFNMMFGSVGVNKKRKNNEVLKFIYKYHEGVTNCVRRSLNINYFYEKNNL